VEAGDDKNGHEVPRTTSHVVWALGTPSSRSCRGVNNLKDEGLYIPIYYANSHFTTQIIPHDGKFGFMTECNS